MPIVLEPLPPEPAALLPDAVAVAVAWARADPGVSALVGTRVATNLPETPTLPFLRCSVVPGAAQDQYVPLRHALLQWDAFAATGATREKPDYVMAALVMRTVEAALRNLEGVRVSTTAGDAWLYGAVIAVEPHRVDEPESPWARYRMDTLLTMRAD